MKEDNKPSELQRVKVKIFEEVYNLKTDDPEGLSQLVRIVDTKMKAIARDTRTLGTYRIAVLAALRIAEDYLQLKKDYDELRDLLGENK